MGMGVGGSGPAPQMSISGLPMTMDVNEFPALANRMGGMNLQGNMDGTMPGGSGVARYHNALHGTAGSRTPRSCTHARLPCSCVPNLTPHRTPPHVTLWKILLGLSQQHTQRTLDAAIPCIGSSNTRTPPVEPNAGLRLIGTLTGDTPSPPRIFPRTLTPQGSLVGRVRHRSLPSPQRTFPRCRAGWAGRAGRAGRVGALEALLGEISRR